MSNEFLYGVMLGILARLVIDIIVHWVRKQNERVDEARVALLEERRKLHERQDDELTAAVRKAVREALTQ